MKSALAGIIALALTTSACQSVSYVMKSYGGVEVKSFSYLPEGQEQFTTGPDGQQIDHARTYRVFDKPDEDRLMITPSFSAAAAAGSVQGLTLGLTNPIGPEALFRNAALAYLKSTGRDCKAITTELVIKFQYEVKYDCSASS